MSVSADDTLARCRDAGLRCTKALEELLAALLHAKGPVTLVDLTESPPLASINAPCQVHELEEEIRTTTGFQGLYHELKFFGVCPKCA